MSTALVRQALAFVDPEETKVRGQKRRVNSSRPQGIGQVSGHPKKSIKQLKSAVLPEEGLVEENIKKLLVLSTQTANKAVAEKIVQRAIKGKPLVDKIEDKVVEEESILFPELNKELTKRKKSKRNNKKIIIRNNKIHM